MRRMRRVDADAERPEARNAPELIIKYKVKAIKRCTQQQTERHELIDGWREDGQEGTRTRDCESVGSGEGDERGEKLQIIVETKRNRN